MSGVFSPADTTFWRSMTPTIPRPGDYIWLVLPDDSGPIVAPGLAQLELPELVPTSPVTQPCLRVTSLTSGNVGC